MKSVQILREAQHDVLRGFFFYEGQDAGLGAYFRESIDHDIQRVGTYFGQHANHFGFHRAFSQKFPYAIYYRDHQEIRQIIAILDMRQSPDNIQATLETR